MSMMMVETHLTVWNKQKGFHWKNISKKDGADPQASTSFFFRDMYQFPLILDCILANNL